jgi:NAD(P)-dependent dehydrogenase (short-subunit alcohol dehydrogenase family)
MRRPQKRKSKPPGNVSSQKFCERVVARTVKEFGTLDVLVNNAAFQVHTARFEDLTAKHFDETLKTNLYGYFYMAQAAVKQMKSGSAIVNTGSVTGILGNE